MLPMYTYFYKKKTLLNEILPISSRFIAFPMNMFISNLSFNVNVRFVN